MQQFILKQALTYLRVAGESWPLTRERMRFEIQALLKHNELAPGLVPVVYDHDVEMSLVIMEYLGEHEVMRKPLVARQRLPNFVDQISTYLVNSLFYTSDLYLTGLEKKELQIKCINPHLCKLQEDFVYTLFKLANIDDSSKYMTWDNFLIAIKALDNISLGKRIDEIFRVSTFFSLTF